LREIGITKPILVGGGTQFEQIPLFAEHDLTLTGASVELLEAAEEVSRTTGKRIRTHLKIDTGMERVGVREYEAEALIQKSASVQSSGDRRDLLTFCKFGGAGPKVFAPAIGTLRGSAGCVSQVEPPGPAAQAHVQFGRNPEPARSAFRHGPPGVLFYGVYPGPEVDRVVHVEPALTWHAKVSYSKRVQPGRVVSYGSLWQAEVETRIVTVPCGYADGYFRRMTNQAQVVIRGKKYPQVGRICMDQFMVNVGDEDVRVGEDVILLGDGDLRGRPCRLGGHERIRGADEHQFARAARIRERVMVEWGGFF
jgi:alanine racemase